MPFIQTDKGVDLIDHGLNGKNVVARHKIDNEPNKIDDNPQPPVKRIAQNHGGLGGDREHKGEDIDPKKEIKPKNRLLSSSTTA